MADKIVLVCPMDWGLGHASRCIPVIKAFSKAGCSVVAAMSGPGGELIRQETWRLPVRVVPFPGFTVSYSRYFLFGRLMMQLPGFLYHVKKEKKILKELVKSTNPDLIISDNRYGLVHDSVPSVLITHQLRPSLPYCFRILENTLSGFIRGWASTFHECWIPDYPNQSAAGALINGWEKLPGARFTGWLSRFNDCGQFPRRVDEGSGFDKNYRFRVLFLLSGPEPHRSILEKKIIDGCMRTGVNALVVRGLPGIPFKREVKGATEIISFLASADLRRVISNSQFVVCRSGYSSVMDLLALEKKALLVPTPGQPEQEYLGRWLSKQGWFSMVRQKDFDVREIMKMVNRGYLQSVVPGPAPQPDLLQNTINDVVGRLC